MYVTLSVAKGRALGERCFAELFCAPRTALKHCLYEGEAAHAANLVGTDLQVCPEAKAWKYERDASLRLA